MKTPWHLWVVGIIAVLWNAVGGYDYIMTIIENEKYLSHFTPEQRAYYASMPILMVIFWTIAIWSSVLASLLLLLRKKLAVLLFLVSLVTMIISFVWGWFFSDIPDSTTAQWIMVGVIWIGAFFFLWYARAMAKAGILT